MERENYRICTNLILKVFFSLLILAKIGLNSSNAQNIYGLEPIQVVGQMNGYSTAAGSNSSYRKVSVTSGNPTDGRGQWFKTYNVQSSGGDFTPRNMTGGGGSGFLFISGPSSNRFANKWVFSGVGQGAVNVVNTCNAYNSGNDMGLNMNAAGYYSFVFNDVGYTVSNAKYYVAYTNSAPINVTHTAQRLNFDRSAQIDINTSASPSLNENIYVRYTTSADFSSANSSNVVQATASGSSWIASIPAQAAGSTVKYLVFSSTVSLNTLNSMSELDKSLSTLKYDDNSGSNYSYTLTNAFVSVASGNFSDTATWGASQLFSGASYTISNSHVVALNQDMTVSNLTINSGGTFSNSSFTLNVMANGSLNNNGAYTVTSGRLNFAGAGTLGGSQACTLNDLTINSGTVTLSQVPTINGTLLINGGNVSAAPIYGSASTLAYNITYNRFNEWNANGIESIGITAGYPNNVEIRSGTFEIANSSTLARALNGSLTINLGATFNISSANMTLTIGADLINNGTFTASNGIVVFPSNCAISGNASVFNNISLNGNTTLNNVTVNGILNFNTGASIVSGTLNYGSSSTLKYNLCPSLTGSEWPTNAGPFNITLNSNAGSLTLNGSRTINGSLNIGSASTLDVSSSHYTLSIGNNGSIVNSGTFNAQSGLVVFAGAANVTGTISFNDVSIAGGVNFGASSTVNNRLTILPNGYVNTNPCTYAASSTLVYNNGSTYVAGSEWLSGITTGAGVPFHVQVGNGNANSALSLGNAAYTLRGNLTIDTSAGAGLFMGNTSSVLNISGDFINNGNNAANLNPGAGRINFNGVSTQNIGGSNSNSLAFSFNSITLNNANGLVLNKAISIGSSGVLTLINGILTTDITNIIIINNSSISSISGASSTAYINGPISRALPSNYTTSSSFLFPIGKGSNYMPLTLVNPKTGTGSIILTASVENTNSNGSVGSMLSAISNTEYWRLTASGNFINSSISLTRSASNGIYNAIAKSNSLNGIYNSIGGTVSSNSILSSDTTSGNDLYFVLGSLSVTTINADGGVVANPGAGSSGYFGSTITISGTQLAGITELRIGGANGRIIPIVSQTDTSITIFAQDTSGAIYVSNGISSVTSNETYLHLGYISNSNGDWNTSSTWLGNTIPPLTSSVYVKDSVDLSNTLVQSNLNILSLGKLNINNGDTLNINNLSNAGMVYVNGVLSINDYSTNSLNGIITCSNDGAINQYDTLSNLGTIDMQGLLKILSSGRILNNGPIYANTSNLFYSTGSSYIRGKEWSAISGNGYPNHININNGSTLNIGTLSSAIALAGNLNLGDGNGAGNLNMQSANQYIQINGNLNIGSSSDTSTLTLSSSIGGDIKVAGNWIRTANGKFVNNTRAVFFIGSGLSEINGSGGAIFDYFISQKTSSAIIRLLSNLNVLASASGNAISLSSGTEVDLNGFSLNLTNSTSSNILVDGGVSSFTGIIGSQINFTNGIKTITSSNAGSLLFGSSVKLIASNGGINFGAGISTVNGSLQINSGGYVLTNPCIYGNGSTLIYNNGSTYVVGSEWLSGIAAGAGVPFHVKLGNGNANSALSLGNAAYTLRGNLTIDTSAGAGLFMGNTSSVLNIAGDFINNGNNAANLNPGSGRINFNGTSTQNISGSNAHSSAFTFNSISLNNANGLVLNKPINIGSNGVLTLTNGTITTDVTNTLIINNTSLSAISGASSTSYINGPISRALPSNYSTSSSYLFPIGKGSNYMPLTLVNPKTGAGSIIITANVENANSNGSVGSMLSAISNTEYWQLTASGNFTNSSISLARNTSNGIYNTIARSTNLSGIYNSIGGTVSTNSILNSDTTSGNDQYFVLGSSSVTSINTSGGVVANPGTGSSGYFGSTITISGTQLSGVTELRIGGSNGRIIPIVSQTDTSISILAQDTSGLIYVTDGVSSAISNEAYTHLGYISNASGDWNTTSTWLGNTIPVLNSSAYVKDSVDLSSSISQSNLNILTSGKLNIINGDSLIVSNLSNAGLVYVNGVLSINDYSTNSLNGIINCSNDGIINQYDTLSNLGAINMQGFLMILSSGRILNNGPIYSSTSNLYYSTASNYSRGKEWSAISGNGYPNHITINNGSTLNIGTLSSAIALAGNLNLGDGNGAGNLNMQSANQHIQINGNLNIGSNRDTSTLTLSNSIGGDIKVAGNWIRSANGKFVNNTRAVFFIGSGLSEINGSGGAIFDYFISQKTSSASIRLMSNVTVLASASGNAISLSSGTEVDLNGFSLNLTNSTSSNILVDGGNASFTGIVGSLINFTNGVKTITSSNTGRLTFGSNVKLIASNGGINFGVDLTIVNGSLLINSGGYVLNNSCIYGNGSTLVYNTTGTYTAGTEWVSNLSSGTGVPYNVTVSNNTNLSFGSTNQYRQLGNDITIANGATLTLSNLAGGDLRIKGNWKNDNITVGQGLIHNNRAIILNGVANQSMTNESDVITIGYLLLDKPSGTAILNDSLTLNGTSGATAQVLQLNNVGSLDLNGNVLTIAGNQVRSILCNASRLITGSSGSQLNFPSGTGVALIEGAGTLTLDSNIIVSIYKGVNFGLNKTTIKGTLSIYPGSFCSTNSPLYGANANLIYNTGNYSTSNEWTLTSVPHIIYLNLTNSSNALSLSGNKIISGILNINSGNVLTNNDTLFMSAGSTLNRIGGYIIGNLAKYFDVSSINTNTFEIGTSLGYTPITISFPSINTPGFVTCRSNDSDYAFIASSGLKPTKSVNRNWLIASKDVSPINYNVLANYLSTDNDNGVSFNFYKASIYSGSAWSSKLNPTFSPNSTTSSFSGISSFGNLQIGEDSTSSSSLTSISIKAYLQGLYIGTSTMNSAPFNADGVTSNSISDTIQIELHEANAPYSLVNSTIDTINTSGLANVNFPNTVIGNSYYVVLKHRNSVATWSSVPVLFSATGTSFDFSTSDAQAYGNNLTDDGNGVYLIYAGDINQDGSVDFNDYPDLDIGSSNGDLGYLPCDLNGDASIDFNDYPLIDLNSSNGIIALTP